MYWGVGSPVLGCSGDLDSRLSDASEAPYNSGPKEQDTIPYGAFSWVGHPGVSVNWGGLFWGPYMRDLFICDPY